METITLKKDYANKKVLVKCQYYATLPVVWDAHTNPLIMEKWFAPQPFKAVTKSVDFRVGGHWLYYMLSPEGEKFWGITHYKKIVINEMLEVVDGFCDENGKIDETLPQAGWTYHFTEGHEATTVDICIAFPDEDAMKTTLDMGFEEGFKQALGQLRELIGRVDGKPWTGYTI